MRTAGLIASLLLVVVGSVEAQVTTRPPTVPSTVPPRPPPSQPPAVRPPVLPAPGTTGAPVRDAVRSRTLPVAKPVLKPLDIDYHEDAPRRTAAFLGITFQAWATQPCVEKIQMDRIASAVRQQIAGTGRFDTIRVAEADGTSRDATIGAVQKEIDARDEQMAKARLEAQGENYDFKYGETLITGDAIRQVHDSAYGYDIVLGEPVITTVRTAQGERHIATIPVTVTFYKIETFDANGNPIPPGQAVRQVPAGQVKFNLVGSGAADPCAAVHNAANGGFVISDQIEEIPAFRLRAQITEYLGRQRITMRPGKNEDVKIGDEYDIYEVRQDGSKVVIGRAVVTRVGPGLVYAGDGASRADVDRTELRVIQLEQGHNPDDLRGSHLEKRPG